MLSGTCHCGRASWTLAPLPTSTTACNCTICRRYGALWAYGHINHSIRASGPTTTYTRASEGDIDFHFCPTCGCLTHYVGHDADDDGRYWTAVNLRMTDDPAPIAALPVTHFDGHDSFARLPADTRTLRDMWF